MADSEEEISTQSLDTEDTTKLTELDPSSGVIDSDLLYVHKANGDDVKTTAKQIKDYTYPPEADSLTTGLVNTSAQAFSGAKTFNNGISTTNATVTNNLSVTNKVTAAEVEVPQVTVTSRLDVNGDIYQNGEPFTPGGGGSALVPSMTMAEYDEVEDKEDGQIREITDAPESEIPFVILDDTKNTASNVLSAQKCYADFGFELGSNDNGYYRKWNNGLLECWGKKTHTKENQLVKITLPYNYKDTNYNINVTFESSDTSMFSFFFGGTNTKDKANDSFNVSTRYGNNEPTGLVGFYWQTIGYWK